MVVFLASDSRIRQGGARGWVLKKATESSLRLPVGQIGKTPASHRHNLGFYLVYNIISSDFLPQLTSNTRHHLCTLRKIVTNA